MTTDPLASFREILASLPELPKHRELRCGEAIYRWLQSHPAPKPDPVAVGRLTRAVFGIPIRLDSDMGRGTWAYFEDGVEVQRSQVGDGDRVWFVPGTGFITTTDDTIAATLDGGA